MFDYTVVLAFRRYLKSCLFILILSIFTAVSTSGSLNVIVLHRCICCYFLIKNSSSGSGSDSGSSGSSSSSSSCTVDGMEMVQVTLLRRTLASSP